MGFEPALVPCSVTHSFLSSVFSFLQSVLWTVSERCQCLWGGWQPSRSEEWWGRAGGGRESAPSTFSQEWLTVFVIRSLQRYEPDASETTWIIHNYLWSTFHNRGKEKDPSISGVSAVSSYSSHFSRSLCNQLREDGERCRALIQRVVVNCPHVNAACSVWSTLKILSYK